MAEGPEATGIAASPVIGGYDQQEARSMIGGRWGNRLLQRWVGCLAHGSLCVQLPDGTRIGHRAPGAGPNGTVILHRWGAVRRLLLGGDIGFAEAFIDGAWSSPDLPALIELAALNEKPLSAASSGTVVFRMLRRLRHVMRANSRPGSRRNVMAHYDLGNDFYRAWIDDGMTYSAGLYGPEATTLEAAQAAKYERITELLDIQQGQSVLEIGCGWGGMAERLARAGCAVTGITLSPSQLAYAQARLQAQSLSSNADLRLQDYRDTKGVFDRIVSIEMFEAVGESYWPLFFRGLKDRLARDGVAVMQVISIEEGRFSAYRRSSDFIQSHVFPGGMLPSPGAMRQALEQAGLVVHEYQTFGDGYARTLAEWRRRFHAAWPRITMLGFDARFRRLWDYYLSYCEGGFRAGAIDVGLWKIGHGPVKESP